MPLHCSCRGRWTMPSTAEAVEIPRQWRADASIVTKPSCTCLFSSLLHTPPCHPGLLCSLAACPSPNEDHRYLLTHSSRNLPGNWQLLHRKSAVIFSIFQVWYKQTESLHLFHPPPPSGELILSLKLLIPQEGWWLLSRACCLHSAPECAVSMSLPGVSCQFSMPGKQLMLA